VSEEPIRRCFEFNGLHVSVSSGHPDDLEWLEEFLTPQFRIVDDRSGEVRLDIVHDAVRYQRLMSGHDGVTGESVACFALDQQVIRLPSWRLAGGGRLYSEENRRVLYRVSADSTAVEIVAGERSKPRVPAMRVIREFGMNHGLSGGGLFVHASAFARGDGALLIAGPSGAGKTTLLSYLLSLGGSDFLANDRVLATLGDEAMRLRGMPTITTLRSTTLDLLPTLGKALQRSSYRHHLTLAEGRQRGGSPVAWNDGRYGLTPRQYCSLLGVGSKGEASGRALIFPQQTHLPGGIDLAPIAVDEAVGLMQVVIFGIGCWTSEARVFALDGDRTPPSAAELRARCVSVAKAIPCFRCRLGEQAYDDPAHAAAVLALVVEPGVS